MNSKGGKSMNVEYRQREGIEAREKRKTFQGSEVRATKSKKIYYGT